MEWNLKLDKKIEKINMDKVWNVEKACNWKLYTVDK